MLNTSRKHVGCPLRELLGSTASDAAASATPLQRQSPRLMQPPVEFPMRGGFLVEHATIAPRSNYRLVGDRVRNSGAPHDAEP